MLRVRVRSGVECEQRIRLESTLARHTLLSFRDWRILAVLIAAGAPIRAESPDVATRIQGVEEGLRPGVTVRGTHPVRWPIAERLRFYKVPAVSVAVINNRKLEWARGYGVVAADGKPVDRETVFQARSISKSVSAMVALRLTDEGRLALDEDVNLRLSSWKAPVSKYANDGTVTLRGLLSHSAGLSVEGFAGYANGGLVPVVWIYFARAKP